ncbi:MAG: hypothetical protein RLZZ618_1755 [Pseudomonadota bacterium]|jgi:heme exporter protein A
MLNLHDIACAKGERLLFRHVHCTLARGAWVHVAGANGIGKTSLLRIVCGLALPAAGEVRWNGQPVAADPEAFRRELLYVGHDSGLQGLLSARENLRVSTMLGGAEVADAQIDDALARMGLAGREDLPCRVLSQGQKRRVAFARLATSTASLWVLDEPFVAMDVHALSVLETLIGEHLERGGMAMLTSHQPVVLAGRAPQMLELTS